MVAIPFRSRVRDPLMELWDDPAISAALGTSLAISAAGFGTCKGVDLSLQGRPYPYTWSCGPLLPRLRTGDGAHLVPNNCDFV